MRGIYLNKIIDWQKIQDNQMSITVIEWDIEQ